MPTSSSQLTHKTDALRDSADLRDHIYHPALVKLSQELLPDLNLWDAWVARMALLPFDLESERTVEIGFGTNISQLARLFGN